MGGALALKPLAVLEIGAVHRPWGPGVSEGCTSFGHGICFR